MPQAAHDLLVRVEGGPSALQAASSEFPADAATVLSYLEKSMGRVLAFHESVAATPLRTRHNDNGVQTVYIKDEARRMGQKAFKIVGCKYAIRCLEESGALKPGDTLTTMTDGNHGAAVARVAQDGGYKCVIFVPQNMKQERINTIEGYGASCVVVEGMYDDAIEEVKRQADANGWHLVCDTSWEGYEAIPLDIVAGYQKIFDEAYSAMPAAPTHIFLQCGVGGFAAAGVAYAVNRMVPRPKLICVEPEDADCILHNARLRSEKGALMCEGETDSIMR